MSGKWKSKLLSSGVPLEFQVARMLVEAGFSIHGDYAYCREDGGVLKDFSVDIRATAYPPFEEDRLLASLELLLECKHRQKDNKWLFFPDPNRDDFSPFTLGRTVRAIDEFSRRFLDLDCTTSFDEAAAFCYKGLEVEVESNAAHDGELRRGLSQLQFALPRLICESARFNLYGHKTDSAPFFVCPILVTTSEILVARDNVTLEEIAGADSLLDFATPHPFVVVYQDLGPDFVRHTHRECSNLDEEWLSAEVVELDAFRKKRGEYDHLLPSSMCFELAHGEGKPLRGYFSQFIVTSLESLPSVLEAIKSVCLTAVGGLSRRRKKFVR